MIRFLKSITIQESIYLISISILFILLRLPSVIEPHWYGDEGIYSVIAHALRDGSVLYRDIWDNKPPFLYLIYTIFNGDLFFIKSFSIMIGIASIISVYILSKKLIHSSKGAMVSTACFALLFGLPMLEGNIANAENFMLLPTAMAYILLLSDITNVRRMFFSGLLLSCAVLIKVVAVFDTAALCVVMVLILQRRNDEGLQNTLRQLMRSASLKAFLTGLVILPILVSSYFLIVGAFPQFLKSTFATNVGYVGFENHFIFPQGLLSLKVLLLVSGLYFLYKSRKKLSQSGLILSVWMIFALFSVYFSARPYTHYILMGLIPFSLLVGYSSANFNKRIGYALFTLVVGSLIYTHFPLYLKNIRYYENYIHYVSGAKNFREYTAFFDRNAVYDYELASFINSRLPKNSKLFFWSDSGHLYTLTNTLPPGRYIVSYHLESYPHAMRETIEVLQKKPVDYIISTRPANTIPREMLRGYSLIYTINRTQIYEKSE